MSTIRPDDADRTVDAPPAAAAQPKRAAAQTERAAVHTERGDLPGEIELLPSEERASMRARWDQVQTGFVDEPRRAVQDAHDLVGDLVASLTRSFAQQRDRLEGTWSSGNEVSTEDLRRALQRYRSLFNQLLGS